MAINFPGPLIAELFYEIDNLTHKHTISLAHTGVPTPGLSPDQYDVDLKGGGTATLEQFLLDYEAVYSACVAIGANIIRYDVWYSDQTSFDRQFITALPIGLPGDGGGAQNSIQATLSFRSAEGGVAKIAIMEPGVNTGGENEYRAYATGIAPVDALFDFVVAPTSAILARDTSYLIAPSYLSKGQNEKVWRQRHR